MSSFYTVCLIFAHNSALFREPIPESAKAEMQSSAEAAVDSVFKGEEKGCQENRPFALHPFCEEAAAVARIITHHAHKSHGTGRPFTA